MLDARQTNHRVAQRWWTCDRCGVPYPETKVAVQKGYVLCSGDGTNNCQDQYGAVYYRMQLQVPYERVPENPPTLPWEDV